MYLKKLAINELIRITKPGGKILMAVWALEQEPRITKKENLYNKENYVEWSRNLNGYR